MPQPPEAAQDFYRRLQRLQLVLVAAARRAWAAMGADFDSSWAQVAPGLVGVTSAAQLAAATEATAYVPALLDETGQPDAPEARIRPRAFAGVAADGRSLSGLLYGAVVRSKVASGRGLEPPQALDVGGRWLDGLLQTTVTDAGRGAVQAEIAVRDGMGWVRMVNPPCCGRCAILAGRWYRFNAGFQRHPRCDCTAIPAMENQAGDLRTSPADLFRNGHVNLSKREAERLAAGDDPLKVINASRDMWRARIQEQKRAAKDAEKGATADDRDQRARMGLENLFAATRSRVEAVRAMQAAGFTD